MLTVKHFTDPMRIKIFGLAISIIKQHFNNMGSLGAAPGGETGTLYASLLHLNMREIVKCAKSVINKEIYHLPSSK